MNQHYLQLYADFIVKVGVNVQPRQNFIIRRPIALMPASARAMRPEPRPSLSAGRMISSPA